MNLFSQVLDYLNAGGSRRSVVAAYRQRSLRTADEDVLFYLGNGKYGKNHYGEQSLVYKPEDIYPFK